MNPEHSVETTGETIEEAIAKGLEILGVNASEVMVEVLEEPVQGVFGLEGRPAVVRLQLFPRSQSTVTETATTISRPYIESTPIVLPTAPVSSPAETVPYPDYMDQDDREPEDASVPFLSDTDDVPETEFDEEASIARVVLGELLERLGVRGRIRVKRARPSDQADSAPWIFDVAGGNSARLIGRRGDTLASLQYVARLITSRELQRRSEIIIDVDGYKARRARQLHSLALRMADEAVERGKVVPLEPMPPHERRIIHLALRERDDVTTKSIGEGAGRKVTIVPKNASS